jgi:hypothetical protein
MGGKVERQLLFGNADLAADAENLKPARCNLASDCFRGDTQAAGDLLDAQHWGA